MTLRNGKYEKGASGLKRLVYLLAVGLLALALGSGCCAIRKCKKGNTESQDSSAAAVHNKESQPDTLDSQGPTPSPGKD